jgi:hypothetical protein
MLLNNLGIKITSLLLALAVYAHVYARQEQTTVLHLPVVFEKLPDGLTWRGEVPTRVPCQVRARGAELIKLRAQPPHLVISLEHARVGLLQRPLAAEDVVLPPKAEATIVGLVYPQTLALTIEPRAVVTRPVAVSLRGRPAEGKVLASLPRVTPETLSISGPASLLARLDSIGCEPLVLDRRTASFQAVLRVRTPESTRPRLEEVTVAVELTEGERRTLGPVAVTLPAGWRRGWRVEPESARAILSGPADAIRSLQAREFRIQVPDGAAGEPAGVRRLEVILSPSYRGRISVESVEPREVRIVSPALEGEEDG